MRLRHKLGDDTIQTVHGVGYRIPHERSAAITHNRLERAIVPAQVMNSR